MKFKKIFKQFLLASVIAFFLSLINLNLYNSNPVPTINSTVSNISQTSQISQFSFAPSFGIERGHASWLSDAWDDMVDTISGIFDSVLGIVSGLIGALDNLFQGDSVAEGWNCNYNDATNRKFLGGETCKHDSGAVVRVCESDKTKITLNTLEGRKACPAAKHICKFGWSDAEQLRIDQRIADTNQEIKTIKTDRNALWTQINDTNKLIDLYERAIKYSTMGGFVSQDVVKFIKTVVKNRKKTTTTGFVRSQPAPSSNILTNLEIAKLISDISEYTTTVEDLTSQRDNFTDKLDRAERILKRLNDMNKKKNIVYYHPDLRYPKETSSQRTSVAAADLACKQGNHAPTTLVK